MWLWCKVVSIMILDERAAPNVLSVNTVPTVSKWDHAAAYHAHQAL